MSAENFLNEARDLAKSLQKKENELVKRKELMQQMAMSEVVLQKNQAKEGKIERQIEYHKSTFDAKIQYFRSEISNKEEKLEKDIRELKERYEHYRTYCNDQIKILETKLEGILQNLEHQKQSENLSIADDKIIKRLEIEIEQLKEQQKNKMERYFKEKQEETRYLQKQRLEEIQQEEEKQRQEEYRKRELAMIDRRVELDRAERLAEQRRQERQEKIKSIMKIHNCDEQTAKDMYMYNLTIDSAKTVQIQQSNDIYKLAKEIRLKYPQYKYIVSELDKEYTSKMVRLEGDALVKFLESMKPLIEMKLQFESDETALDEKHQEIYQDLPLDQQLECSKLKTKQKRYKYLETKQKTRSEKINDSLGCV